MRGVVDFIFDNVKENNEMKSSSVIVGNEQMTITEFVSKLDEYNEPIMFVRHLEHTFRLLEDALAAAGYQCKYCKDKGTGYHAWNKPLKDKEYSAMIFGEGRSCIKVKFNHFKMYDAERWLGTNRDPFQKLSASEELFLEALCKDSTLESTPSADAWKNSKKNYYDSKTNNEEAYNDITYGVEGGIILGEPGHYSKAYHYDVTSLYPFILSQIEYFPSIDMLEYTTADEKADHKHYAYWIFPEFHCDCDIDIVPAGSIKSPLLNRNCYKETALMLYEAKDKAKKGTHEYTIAKLRVNSFIGRIAKKNLANEFYPYCNKDEGKVNRNMDLYNKIRHVEEFSYLIARARSYMLKKVDIAENCGANIIQINTDGFFTDKPIEYDKERFLGSLRFEYETNDLTIFASNQYVCPEEVCIAGLPKNLYVAGKFEYKYPVLQYNHQRKRVEYTYRKMTLGE